MQHSFKKSQHNNPGDSERWVLQCCCCCWFCCWYCCCCFFLLLFFLLPILSLNSCFAVLFAGDHCCCLLRCINCSCCAAIYADVFIAVSLMATRLAAVCTAVAATAAVDASFFIWFCLIALFGNSSSQYILCTLPSQVLNVWGLASTVVVSKCSSSKVILSGNTEKWGNSLRTKSWTKCHSKRDKFKNIESWTTI